MPCYESVFIARQDISASQAEGLTENFSQIITDNGGNVVDTESWGLRSIAYRIKKNRKGHYVLMNIDAPAPAVHEMERLMRLHDDVMRVLTIKVDSHEDGPSVQMQKKEERGDRRERR